jgi:hypothetical protein
MKRALERGRRLREQFRARGEFTTADFCRALRKALKRFRGDAYEGLVQHVAEAIDREATKGGVDGQPDLPGFDWDLCGEYRLGGGRRVAKRLARLDQAEEMLALVESNLAAVSQASERKQAEMAKLRPYWLAGMTKEEAVAAYRAANPPDAAP